MRRICGVAVIDLNVCSDLLATDFAQHPLRKILQEPEQFRDEWLNSLNAGATHHQNHDGNWEDCQILLKLSVLIDRQKDVKMG